MRRLPSASRRVSTLVLPLAFVAGLTAPACLHAQDRFGAAVVVDGDRVLALKPGIGRGAAGVYVFRRDGDGYALVERLGPGDAATAGESLSPSLSVSGNRALAGSADPAGAWSGHLYVRLEPAGGAGAGAGGWAPAGRVPLDPDATLGAATQTLGVLMRAAVPPARLATLFDEGLGMAVVDLSSDPEGVLRVFREIARGNGADASSWREEGAFPLTRVAPGETAAGPAFDPAAAPPPTAPAVDGDRIAVGLPAADPTGSVRIFRRGAGGVWVEEARLTAPAGLRLFGMSVHVAGDRLLVGAPGSATVVEYRRGSEGWAEVARLVSEDVSAGWSLASDGSVLAVGAPAADGRRGAVTLYARADGAWRPAHRLAPDGRTPGGEFGASLAVSEGVVAVGAPGSEGGAGRVAVFGGAPEGTLELIAWLTPGSGLERVAGGEVRCASGKAAGFDCDNVDLLAFVPMADLGADAGEGVSDLWGWTDPDTGREYALVGRTAGMAVVDVTEPMAPRMVGLLPANASHARDIKVYRDHAFMTGDGAGDHGLVVFDLTRIRDVAPGTEPATFTPDTVYHGISSAHNLVLDPESGFAYPVGASGGGETCGGGLHMVDVRDPLNPTFAGCYTDTEGLIWKGRTHDAQCIVYDGPDARYHGREVCFASNETAIRIVDVTDKTAPEPISVARYPNIAYTHQGWLTDDRRFFYLNDEADELAGLTDRTRTLIWDVAELDDPILVGEYLGPDAATDHNLYVVGDRMYQANYQAGLRVIDISDPLHPVEVGSFDTTPYAGNPPGFAGGAWTAYPFFGSGTVIVSSMNEGLFVLRPRRIVP